MKVSILHHESEYEYRDLKAAASALFMMPSVYQYSSLDALKTNYKTCCDLLIELCDLLRPVAKDTDSKVLKTELTRFKTKLTKMKEAVDFLTDRERAVSMFYDTALSLEGNGRLIGFGFISKHGDKIKGDAEKLSVTAR